MKIFKLFLWFVFLLSVGTVLFYPKSENAHLISKNRSINDKQFFVRVKVVYLSPIFLNSDKDFKTWFKVSPELTKYSIVVKPSLSTFYNSNPKISQISIVLDNDGSEQFEFDWWFLLILLPSLLMPLLISLITNILVFKILQKEASRKSVKE